MSDTSKTDKALGQNLLKSILEWPGEAWAFMILRTGLAVRFFTAGLDKFRGPTDRVELEQMKENSQEFAADMEEFVNGELSPQFEGEKGLDPEKVKAAFGEDFYGKYVEGYDQAVIDLSKIPTKDLNKEIKEFLDFDVGEDKFGGPDGLDLDMVKSGFGEEFAKNFTYKEDGAHYFSEELAKTLVETPKEKLAETIGEKAHGQFVDLFSDLYGGNVIRSGYEFKAELISSLATETPGQLAQSIGPEAHAQIVTTFKKSILYGPDFITTTYGYGLDHYYSNQGKFLEVQEVWYANIPIMPKWALGPFVYGLGYILLLVGITTFLGIKTRLSLAVMALTYVALSYGSGLMVAANASPKDLMNLLLLSLFVHLFMTVYALTLSKHEKLALVK